MVRQPLCILYRWGLPIAIALLFWEIVIRACIESPIPFHHDERFGWMPVPQSSGLYTKEGWSYTRYNEYGFRGSPIELRKNGELRVVCLGDSFTEGQQIGIEETYPSLLQASFERNPLESASRVTVFNAGRAHATPAGAIQFSDAYLSLFDPDWVVVLLREGSLMDATSGEKEVQLRLGRKGYEPFVSWRRDSESYLKRLIVKWGVRRSAALHLGYVRASRLLAAPDRPGHGRRPSERPLPILETLADYVVTQLQRRYPRLLLVHLPSEPLASIPRGGEPSPEELALRVAVGRARLPAVFLREALREDFEVAGEPHFGFFNTVPGAGHPNARAHKVIAAAVEAELRRGSAH